VFFGIGDGTFQPFVQESGGAIGAFTFGDFNEDGRIDVLVTRSAGCEMHLGDGTRPNSAGTWSNCPAGQFGTAMVGDVNGDGHLDLVAAKNPTSGALFGVELGDGAAHFGAETDYSLSVDSGNVGSAVLADFDGDGTLDVVTTNAYNAVLMAPGDGHGAFGPPTRSPVAFVCCDASGLYAADVNGDGRPDLVFFHPLQDDVGVLLNNGNGTFQSEIDYAVARRPGALVMGDFNHDGNVDVAAADWQSSDVVVLSWAACGGTVPSGFGVGVDAGTGADASARQDAAAEAGAASDASDGGFCEASGPCNGTCQADGRCMMKLASAQVLPTDIALDSSNVYWTVAGSGATGGTVLSLPKGGAVDGGAPSTLASGQNFPSAIAINGTDAFWTDSNGQTVMKVALTGGSPTTIASAQNAPSALALDGTNVYWANLGGQVMQAPLGGGTATTLGGGISPWGIAVSGGTLYWTTYPNTNYTTLNVFALNIAAHTGSTFASVANLGNPQRHGVVADTSHLYFTGSDVYSIPLSGGTVTTIAVPFGSPIGLAVDGSNVYFTAGANSSFGEVLRAPLTGGSVTTLATGQANPGGIAVDGTSVYWVTGGTSASSSTDGTVMKLTPK
jgi:hypothetical protein